jgi:hypothetical protein
VGCFLDLVGFLGLLLEFQEFRDILGVQGFFGYF